MTVHITNRFQMGNIDIHIGVSIFRTKRLDLTFCAVLIRPKKCTAIFLFLYQTKKRSWFSSGRIFPGLPYILGTLPTFSSILVTEPHTSALFSQGLWSINKMGRGFVREKSLICP